MPAAGCKEPAPPGCNVNVPGGGGTSPGFVGRLEAVLPLPPPPARMNGGAGALMPDRE